MRNFIIILATIGSVLLGCTKESCIQSIETLNSINISERGKLAHQYCMDNNLNTEFCVLINMSIHSGKKRFHVWDFNTMQIRGSYLVSHGCCDSPWSEDDSKEAPKFSNIENSHCSALGKYKTGRRGWSSFGVHVNYRLHGMETTNSHANERDIVFHSWERVSDQETFPYGTPEGWGCPAISNNAFKEIDLYLKSSKSTLIWIF